MIKLQRKKRKKRQHNHGPSKKSVLFEAGTRNKADIGCMPILHQNVNAVAKSPDSYSKIFSISVSEGHWLLYSIGSKDKGSKSHVPKERLKELNILYLKHLLKKSML